MKKEIEKAVQILNKGGTILYPTDTIWGIGCDATNPDAVSKIYEIKKRSKNKSMIILLENVNRIYSYVKYVPEIAIDIAEISEKPITIIYPNAKNLAKNLPAKDGSIGIRIVKDHFCRKLLQKFRRPIVSTSANLSGKKSALYFENISDEIKNSVDYIVDYKQDDNSKKQSSSVIKIGIKNEISVIRK